jgi:hypothetical protein
VESVRLYVEAHGVERCGFLTITVADDCRDAKEFQRRWNSWLTNVGRDLLPSGVWIRQRQRRGAWHLHAVVDVGLWAPDYLERVQVLNKDFLEEPRVKQNVLELPLRSVETCYRFLSELVAPHRFKDSVTLVPMGPKPHILASILVSMRFPEVSCMRVNMTRERPEKVQPTGEIIAARVVVRRHSNDPESFEMEEVGSESN